MSGMVPVALYGLKVPAGDVMVPAEIDFPATFHITMAAIDPSAAPKHTGTANGDTPARATLKILYAPEQPDDDDDSDLDSEEEAMQMQQLLGGASDDDDEDEDEQSSSDDEEKNGGPSDPSKSTKARKEAAAAQLLKSLKQDDSDDDEMEDASSSPMTNGFTSKSKGKGKAVATKIGESSDDESDEDAGELEELVICTLDLTHHYQQPLNITVPENQPTFFKVSGTHAVYLTGNYVIPAEEPHSHDHESEDYDMSPDDDELEGELDDLESDDLDDLEDPRITELESEDDQAPKLVKADKKDKASEKIEKGKNKRAAEESDEDPATLDAIMDKSLKPSEPVASAEQPKLSKKQMKKLKNNAGKAVEAAIENKDVKKEESSPAKNDKKVQFAKELEQGPTGAAKERKAESKPQSKENAKAGKKDETNEKPKASLGLKTLPDGVIIDDKKLGTGPACKKGNKVGMRYIGKLEGGKVFDSNKKGPPFSFTLGTGEVIRGWDSGIPGMSAGGERRVIVPAKLAYGNKATAAIPPNSKLTFDVKLLTIT